MYFLSSGHWGNMLETFVYFFFFRWGCHNCIQCVQSNTLKKIFIFDRKLFISFGHWAKKVRKFSWFFLRGCKNSILYVQRNFLGQRMFLVSFWWLTKQILVHWRKTFGKLFGKALRVSRRTFWWSCLKKNFNNNTFAHPAKNFCN